MYYTKKKYVNSYFKGLIKRYTRSQCSASLCWYHFYRQKYSGCINEPHFRWILRYLFRRYPISCCDTEVRNASSFFLRTLAKMPTIKSLLRSSALLKQISKVWKETGHSYNYQHQILETGSCNPTNRLRHQIASLSALARTPLVIVMYFAPNVVGISAAFFITMTRSENTS